MPGDFPGDHLGWLRCSLVKDLIKYLVDVPLVNIKWNVLFIYFIFFIFNWQNKTWITKDVRRLHLPFSYRWSTSVFPICILSNKILRSINGTTFNLLFWRWPKKDVLLTPSNQPRPLKFLTVYRLWQLIFILKSHS